MYCEVLKFVFPMGHPSHIPVLESPRAFSYNSIESACYLEQSWASEMRATRVEVRSWLVRNNLNMQNIQRRKLRYE